MTITEKLRFLADRTEDQKEFYIDRFLYRYQNGELMGFGGIALETLPLLELELKPQWVFTEDEKVILRNLPDELQWIARDGFNNWRDESGWIYFYATKPTKGSEDWGVGRAGTKNIRSLQGFNHLFQCIQWSDDEPCEFRKYL